MPSPNPRARVVGSEEQARHHAQLTAAATWQDEMPQVPVVLVALCILVGRLEQRAAALESRVDALEADATPPK